MRRIAMMISLITLSMFVALGATAQQTTVYIVRHAEKNLSDSNAKDPALTSEGLQRSYDLDKLLAQQGISAVFSTNYIRTRKTGEPLAKRIGKDVVLYDPTQSAELVAKVKKEFQGKSVLIVGHSNTVLQLVEAFGGKATITEIKDHEYRNLFKLEMMGTSVTTTEMSFGL
jgi:2,3-bisphosphoglycerate-dependent phosphoglycerate mutase